MPRKAMTVESRCCISSMTGSLRILKLSRGMRPVMSARKITALGALSGVGKTERLARAPAIACTRRVSAATTSGEGAGGAPPPDPEPAPAPPADPEPAPVPEPEPPPPDPEPAPAPLPPAPAPPTDPEAAPPALPAAADPPAGAPAGEGVAAASPRLNCDRPA